jgi:hypothetical protein
MSRNPVNLLCKAKATLSASRLGKFISESATSLLRPE